MQNTLEHPSEEEECTLSEVLETCAPLESFLSKEQLDSLISRAEEREQILPEPLMQAYQKQISILSSMQVLDEKLPLVHKQRDIEMMEKPIPSIQEEVQMLYVRRMLPSEYERLQGFPENWTLIDSEL